LGNGVSDVAYRHNIDLNGHIEALADSIFNYLERPDFPGKLQAFAGRLFETYRDRTVRSIMADVFGITENEVVEFVSSKLLVFLTNPQTPDALSGQIVDLAGGYLEDRGATSLRELLKIDENKKDKLDVYLASHFSRLLKSRLPYLVESFNIRQLVVEKINELDVAQVESLLLMVIAKHLKWINIFGALLGGVIGFSQVLLRIFRIV
jgi:uncharacterized membrane protein YheB (UPF0754 family)